MNEQTGDFERNARARLRATESDLNSAALARLAAARERALKAPHRFRLPGAPWTIGLAMATVLGVAMLLGYHYWQGDTAAGGASSQLAENPDELYRDLDFYLWLSESDMGGRG
jgi:hypothetical protein